MLILFFYNQQGAVGPDTDTLVDNRGFIDYVILDTATPWTDQSYLTPISGPWTDYGTPIAAIPWDNEERDDYGIYNQPGVTYATQHYILYNDFVGNI